MAHPLANMRPSAFLSLLLCLSRVSAYAEQPVPKNTKASPAYPDSNPKGGRYEELFRTLIFREVHWTDLPFPEAIRAWERLARENDPEGNGIPLINPPDDFAWEKDPMRFLPNGEQSSNPYDERFAKLHLRQQPASELLSALCQHGGYRFELTERGLRFHPNPPELPPNERLTRTIQIPAALRQQMIQFERANRGDKFLKKVADLRQRHFEDQVRLYMNLPEKLKVLWLDDHRRARITGPRYFFDGLAVHMEAMSQPELAGVLPPALTGAEKELIARLDRLRALTSAKLVLRAGTLREAIDEAIAGCRQNHPGVDVASLFPRIDPVLAEIGPVRFESEMTSARSILLAMLEPLGVTLAINEQGAFATVPVTLKTGPLQQFAEFRFLPDLMFYVSGNGGCGFSDFRRQSYSRRLCEPILGWVRSRSPAWPSGPGCVAVYAGGRLMVRASVDEILYMRKVIRAGSLWRAQQAAAHRP
jgi:hypothetical protein